MVSVEDIHRALLALEEAESGASLPGIRHHESLMRLRYVVAAAAQQPGVVPSLDAVTARVRAAIEDTVRSLRSGPHDAAPERDEVTAALALLALGGGAKGAPRHRRRSVAANALNMPVETMLHRPSGRSRARLDHRSRLLLAIAQVMHERESHFAETQAFNAMAARQPTGSALSDHWLLRFEQYYAIWNSLEGLRNHLIDSITSRQDGEPELEYEHALCALWSYAQFLNRLHQFVENFGGLWILSSPKADQGLADAVWLAQHYSGRTYIDDSRIAALYREHPDLHEFIERLTGHQIAKQLDYVKACTCDLAKPRPNCKLHLTIQACALYIDMIDADWYKLVDWYREPDQYRKVLDPAEAYKRFNLLADNQSPGPDQSTRSDAESGHA